MAVILSCLMCGWKEFGSPENDACPRCDGVMEYIPPCPENTIKETGTGERALASC